LSDSINFKESNNSYSSGHIIVRQGDKRNQFYILNEGQIEVKFAKLKQDEVLLDDDDILSAETLYILKAPSVISSPNAFESDFNGMNYSFVALTDCNITAYKIDENNGNNDENYKLFLKKNISFFFKLLLMIKDTSIRSINEIKKVIKFDAEIEKCSDNFNLLYEYFVKIENGEFLSTFKSNGGNIPTKIEKEFLFEDHSLLLNKVYESNENSVLKNIDIKKIEFYTSLIKTKPEALAIIINMDFKIYKYIFDDLINYQKNIATDLYILSSNTKKEFENFFKGADGAFNKIYSIENKIKSNINAGLLLLKNIILVSKTLEHYSKAILNIEIEDLNSKYSKMLKEEESVKKSTNIYKIKYKDSAVKIVTYSTLSDERKEEIIEGINEMGTIDFSDLSDTNHKKIRGLAVKLQKIFDELYFNIFFKAIVDTEIPTYIKLFLYFGFISETYLTDEQIELIDESLPLFYKESYANMDYPIIPLFDYLQLIYNGVEVPGLSVSGEEFNKLVKKMAGLKGNTIVDTPEGKMRFELENMIKESMRITSDNPRAFIPFLTEESFRANLSTIVNTPEKMQRYISEINNVDYGLFFRELTWKATGKNELIKKEVRPYFIITPNSGIRVQLWQELINNLRASKGRLVVPIIFNGDLKNTLTTSLAHFRWELNKVIAGANWMSPVDGGFVGAYYDYTQYFHKNSDLSIETKEDIKALFNKIKIDRDRFSHDYYLWVNYEKNGIPKLNSFVRSIFYRHIPFSKGIRETLCKLPMFEELDIKFNNIRNRDLRSIEVKYNKHRQKNGELPEDLQKYLDFLKG